MSNDTVPSGQREFRCDHCHGKILIPLDLPPTTGPCPHCSQVITSPAPAAAEAKPAVVPESRPERLTPTPVPAAPVKVENAAESPVRAPIAEEPAAPVSEPASEGAPKTERKGLLLGIVAVAALLVICGVLAFSFFNVGQKEVTFDPGTTVSAEKQEQYYLEKGWEKDARETLDKFLSATTAADRAEYSIRGDELLPEMEKFYAGQKIDDSDTPANAFSVFSLTLEDRKRGIFMMEYDQPPAFEMGEFFVPVVPLGVQYKVEEPDLLVSTIGRASNFASEAIKVQALFKRGPEGLKIDWETYVQTKFRKLREFLELPEAGESRVFRVIVTETVPENREVPAGNRVYLLADPAYRSEDSVRVMVPVDSEIGRALSILNWRGTNGGRVESRTATIELGWTDEETPQPEIKRFICWEFLGVGGEALPGGGARNDR